MVRKLLGVMAGAVVLMTVSGCDEEMLATVSPTAAKVLMVSPMPGAGDMLMDRVRDRDRLHDGSCDACPNPDCPQFKYAYQAMRGGGPGGDGQGDRDRDRLRDGSCGD